MPGMRPYHTLFWFVLVLRSVFSYSPHICKTRKNDTDIQNQCRAQERDTQHFQPLNSSIYHELVGVDLGKKFETFFKLSILDVHRDARFVKDLAVPPEKRQKLLLHCLEAFTEFAKENSLTYWLVHGGLIGWYWNERILPWDMDIDVMVLYYDLINMYAKFNNYVYKGRYLFEINPNSQYRLHQDQDVIDARFIDKKSGLYIDITAVVYDPNRKQLHCKSPHFYDVDDIFPIKTANFSDILTWIPNKTMKLLEKEYGQGSMEQTTFTRGKRLFEVMYGEIPYHWDDNKQLWQVGKETLFMPRDGRPKPRPKMKPEVKSELKV